MPHIANCFPLLKSDGKLIKHDYMYNQICKELNWN